MADICKDIKGIWFRLFDQRAFIQGEHKFFIKEFSSDKDVTDLFSTLQNTTEIKDSLINIFVTTANNHFPTIQIKLPQSIDIVEDIFQLETKQSDESEILNRRRAERSKQYENYCQEIEDFKLKIDSSFQEKETQVIHYYNDLENKLSQI